MADYIDRRVLTNIRIPAAHYIRDDYNTAYQQGCKDMLALVKSITPAADVRENVRGEWKVIIENETFAECKCTNCGAVEYFNHGWKKFNFCPNCGADMRGGGTCNGDSCTL